MKLLQTEINEFIAQRNWQRFHNPKNLAMALSVETSELLEIFQWLTAAQSQNLSSEQVTHLEEEIGDVFIYLTMLASTYGIDPVTAARKKLEKNREKYPAP